jgi:acyl carrier protein
MIMEQNEYLRMLDELFELDPGTLKDEDLLAQQESWDSMRVVEFLDLVEDRLNVTVAPKSLKPCKTMGDLVALMQQQPRSGDSAPS